MLDAAGYAAALYWHFVRALTAFGRREGTEVVRRAAAWQMYFTGVEAVPVVVGVALLVGSVIAVQSLAFLTGTGNEGLLGTVIQVVVIRELGPLVAAILVLGRSGAAIAVELGNMRVNRELELLSAMGIDPHRFVVLPRLGAAVLATMCLCLVFDVVAAAGGCAVARLALHLPVPDYLRIVGARLVPADLVLGLAKTALFGAAIATVSTWQGMAVGRAVTEVPQAASRAVIHGLVLCIALDAALSIAFYAGGFG